MLLRCPLLHLKQSKKQMTTNISVDQDDEGGEEYVDLEEDGDDESYIPEESTRDDNDVLTTADTATAGTGSIVVKEVVKPRRRIYKYTCDQKAIIVRESVVVGKLRKTARKYKVQNRQILHWKKTYQQLLEAASRNVRAHTLHQGVPLHYPKLEDELWNWFEQMQALDITVSTKQMLLEARKLEPNFKNGNVDRMKRWVYTFMERNGLSIRKVTRIGQKLTGHLLEVKKDTTTSISQRLLPGGSLENIQPPFFLNMDQTALFYESKPTRVVAKKGTNTVACRDSGCSARRCTVCVTIAADGTKLPPFFIFKGVPGARLEQELLRRNVRGCCQPKGWFDNEVAPKYFNLILKPYLQLEMDALLLVDHFKVHLGSTFGDEAADLGIDLEFIPAGYTCVLQPVDVCFNALLKKHFRDLHLEWYHAQYVDVGNDNKLPVPNHWDVVNWVYKSFDLISPASIVNTFKSIGYVFPGNTTVECNCEEDGSGIYDIESGEDEETVVTEHSSIVLDPYETVIAQLEGTNLDENSTEKTIKYRKQAFQDLADETKYL